MRFTLFFLWANMLSFACLSQNPQDSTFRPRWYIGTDALIRQESFRLDDPNGQIVPSDWMWNVSCGGNVGLHIKPSLTLETGLYRFTYANRLHMSNTFGFLNRSSLRPFSGLSIPIRAYMDPFARSSHRFRRTQVQLMGGFSWVFMAFESDRKSVFQIKDPSSASGSSDLVVSTAGLVNRHGFNLEGGLNATYTFSNNLALSMSYGYIIGLQTMLNREINYRRRSFDPMSKANQSSLGSGDMWLVGLKFKL